MRAMKLCWLRRSFLFLTLLVALSVCADGWAGDRVPVSLQAQLTSRVCAFDRNFKTRAGASAKVLILHRAGDAESEASASAFARVLSELRLAGIPAAVEEAAFTDGVQLAGRVKSQQIALIYFAVGMEAEMARAASALAGADVLTIGASGELAEAGAVVGFDLGEARPKLVVNVKRAKAQNVSFKSELLELARVVD